MKQIKIKNPTAEKKRVEPFFVFTIIFMVGFPALSLFFLFNSTFQQFLLNLFK